LTRIQAIPILPTALAKLPQISKVPRAVAQLRARSCNLQLYWDIGHLVLHRQAAKGWGASVIPRLSRDIRNDLPGVKGFSERNIGYMIRFVREYPILHQPVAKLIDGRTGSVLQQPAAKLLPGSAAPQLAKLAGGVPEKREPPILQPPVAKLPPDGSGETLQRLVVRLPWKHNVLLFEKLKDLNARVWYMEQTIQNGWSASVLLLMIQGAAHLRQGKAITNFTVQLPPAQSDLALQALKDPYIFDFLTLEEPFHERELETELLRHLQKFLIELGQGFAFVGRQYHISVDGPTA
jgi:predicted nuclease of restriction endonuclease-like (RecB) superfamily